MSWGNIILESKAVPSWAVSLFTLPRSMSNWLSFLYALHSSNFQGSKILLFSDTCLVVTKMLRGFCEHYMDDFTHLWCLLVTFFLIFENRWGGVYDLAFPNFNRFLKFWWICFYSILCCLLSKFRCPSFYALLVFNAKLQGMFEIFDSSPHTLILDLVVMVQNIAPNCINLGGHF